MADPHVGAFVMQLVASAAELDREIIEGRAREGRAGGARQAAFYLVHVGLGWSLERTGRLFARQRSTISHACRQVEDRRDDLRLDRQLSALEAVVREAVTLRLDL